MNEYALYKGEELLAIGTAKKDLSSSNLKRSDKKIFNNLIIS